MEDDGGIYPAAGLDGETAGAAARKRTRIGLDGETNGKKARIGCDNWDLKRVAEIVMVLSAMGEIRSGRDPTPAEKAMVAEARDLLSKICEEVKPKDLFSSDAVRVVAEDLGLNRSRDPIVGYRPNKMSIAEKLLSSKKKMEESKEFATLHSPQPLPVGFGANTESHSTMSQGNPRFHPGRTNPIALSTGIFQSVSTADHYPNLASATSSLDHSHISETHTAATLIKPPTNPLGKGSPVLTTPHSEASHFRSVDARSTGPTYFTQVRAGDIPGKTTTSVQSLSTGTVMLGQTNNLLDHTPVKSEGAYEGYTIQPPYQVVRSQELHTSATQSTPANVLIGHQPSQGLTYVDPASYFTNHSDIAKCVQMILQEQTSDRPNWAPPSIEYMNKSLNCQICKIPINDVESLLVCDACEKGIHLKCLQSYGDKSVSKADWHCPKCLLTSNGKPLPPKFGKVTRSISASKPYANTVGTYSSPEKRAENPDSNSSHQKLVSNRASSSSYLAQSNIVTSQSKSASDSKAASATETQGSNFHDSGVKRENEIHIGSCMKGEDEVYMGSGMKRGDGIHRGPLTDQSKESDGLVCVPHDTQSEISNTQATTSGLLPSDMQRPTLESMVETNVLSNQFSTNDQNAISKIGHHVQMFSHSQACEGTEVPISAEVSADQLNEINEPIADELKSCHLKETPEDQSVCNIRAHDQENSPPTLNGTSDSSDATLNCARALTFVLHSVDWVGDILEAVEEKTYYRSCRINGTLHNLQDHVLIPCKDQKLLPSKLQSLWEDKTNGSTWATVDPYFFPNDLEAVNRPSTPDNSEVYASNNGRTIMAGSVCGPCEVLRKDKFKEEVERRTLSEDTSSLHPIFMCEWLYDESKSIFQVVAD